jgi:Domain of unknown function (DUF4157)
MGVSGRLVSELNRGGNTWKDWTARKNSRGRLGHCEGVVMSRRILLKIGEKKARKDLDRKKSQGELGSGRPLTGAIKSRMESAFGHDFSRVRIHADSSGEELCSHLHARASTSGSDIAFGTGEFKPGTLRGDLLLAHELAHVMQQEQSGMPSGNLELGESERGVLEHDADLSAFRAIGSLWSGVKNFVGDVGRNAAPRMKSGLHLQRCTASQKKQAPPYLGPHSLEAMEEIDRVVENSELLSKMIVFGTVVATSTKGPEEHVATGGPGHEIEAAAEALRAVPVIRRNRVETIISLLLVEHENEMNEKERTFWHNMLTNLEKQR